LTTTLDQEASDALLTTTRSVRRRLDLDRKVPREPISECIEVALQAPIGGASEQWRWLVLDQPAEREAVATYYRDGAAILAQSKQHARERHNLQAHKPYDGAEYLLSVIHRVPVLVIPCVRGRLRAADTLRAASLFGSILPAT